jgi:hypothetical protein
LRGGIQNDGGKRVTIFVGMFGQQAREIAFSGVLAFPSDKVHPELSQKLGEFGHRRAGGLG